ncbi:SMI1/KNR4 family protein [Lysinibacillus mangiferihumi]|uniref:SMI1/KNR4 family protein n=1 Tax=Lysinibacillus mangiferihumi TaxID=1130819 RepID=A0A4U2XTX7_9BACI|nr:SMI1/KNR4 family protein [Lysinibacillus mangiferihumi]TKI50954.1 SMI1/KNR4 family protein [Lysinibacillus mangiferihumi]
MFYCCSSQLTQKDLEEVEILLNLQLPLELKEHYLQYNGGVPNNPCFFEENSGLETRVHVFLPLKFNNNLGYTLEKGFLDFKSKKIIPEKYLPFANDAGGNVFCINLDSKEIVLVYLDLGEVTNRCIKFLANSFTEFINNLEECLDDEVEDDF